MRDLLFVCAFLAVAPPVWGEERLPDPTLPPAGSMTEAEAVLPEAVEKEVPMILNQTLISPELSQAVINQQSVRVGDRLAGWEIKEIQPGRVLLDDGKENRILTTAPHGIKTLMREAP